MMVISVVMVVVGYGVVVVLSHSWTSCTVSNTACAVARAARASATSTPTWHLLLSEND